ncbi:methyltransferase cognate corrinoid protein [Methanimicrococcus blatticola]|nr:methyltransferase cognate corrinoid protein [Methanimicrococcus blatticola]MBZ3936396.1 methyltransferase cognate corrinoid protein [Methanimicrococcus blatticola]MCC2509558.1 methyltransferase cognate corrinoid protein [Methanimicrococcus blatticola]
MSKEEILKALADAVISGDDDAAVEFAQKALDAGIDPQEAIVDGLAKGMAVMGDKYERGEVFVPHLMIASSALYEGMDVLTPHIKVNSANRAVTGIIGTIEGDVHDIGKNLVKTMMAAAGFSMIDLGNDVPLENFIAAAKENKADLISVSALMTTTMTGMDKISEMLLENGYRDSLVFMVGGAPVSPQYAQTVGADGTAKDAAGAVLFAKEATSKLGPAEERWSDSKLSVTKTKYKDAVLKKKAAAGAVGNIGAESAKKVLEEYNKVGTIKAAKMTHMDRVFSALDDKKVDRLPVSPLACSVVRKLVPCSYKEYATVPEKFGDVTYAAAKYLDMDTFVGLTDLSIMANDIGAGVTIPEEDTASITTHLKDYEDIEIPEVKKGTRIYNHIMAGKDAKEKMHREETSAPFVAFHEGPLLTLTQAMGADRVLYDMKTNPGDVHKALDKITDFVCEVSTEFFDQGAADAICVDNLWSNNVIMSADQYWEFDGKYVYDRQLPIFKKYDAPYVIHNCADAVHFDIQIRKFGTSMYSYAYYEKNRDKGSKNYADLIPEYSDICCMFGEVEPIQFMNNDEQTFQNIRNDTVNLMDGVLTTLKDNGRQSKYVLSTGCEVPPEGSLMAVRTMVETVKEVGEDRYKQIIG